MLILAQHEHSCKRTSIAAYYDSIRIVINTMNLFNDIFIFNSPQVTNGRHV